MNILAVSDEEIGIIYNPSITERFKHINLVISCGDLPYYYLEYIISTLNKPLYFVRGNHASATEYGTGGDRQFPWGGVDLHQRTRRDSSGLLMAGIEGCLRYNYGPHQYTQAEMWWMVWMLTPLFFMNRLRFGRYLDVFVAHAPPWRIHDMEDRPHQGIKAYRWLINVFQPTLFLHGHIHLYRHDVVRETLIGGTRVINTYGFREIVI